MKALLMCVCLSSAVVGCSSDVSDAQEPPPDSPPLPAEELQHITDELVLGTGVPGAVVAVSRGDETWIGASGTADLKGSTPMPISAVFQAGSITKMFTGVVVLHLVEEGSLHLDDTIDAWFPAFPNAGGITVDMLLSHTGGITTRWFTDPEVQSLLVADLEHRFTAAEVIEMFEQDPPTGPPGSAMQYANLGYVMLGEIAVQTTNKPLETLFDEVIIAPLGLTQTTYTFDAPAGLVPGYFELGEAVVDISSLPEDAVLSFVGAAGAIHADANDLLAFMRALSTGELVSAASLETMTSEIFAGSHYGRATMLYCPCDDEDVGAPYAGFGHGGHLPGFWSALAHYPDKDATVVLMINRDVVGGVPIEQATIDGTLEAVYRSLP